MSWVLTGLLVLVIIAWTANLGHQDEVVELKELLRLSDISRDEEVLRLSTLYADQVKELRSENEHLRRRLG